MTEALIEVRAASFKYGERFIFSALELEVQAGEVLTILGANGCGKSTLLRCMGGALALTEGSVRIGKQDLSRLDARARARKVGFLFQDHTPAFPFTVLDIATMGRTAHLSRFGSPSGKDRALAEEALDRVGIRHFKDRPYTQLSAGERQLALISRTLVQQPEAIFLDEPTSHLDFKNQVQCLKTIGALAAQGATVVMTTHDPNHAFLFPGRVALMKPGGAILVGPASAVVTDATLSEAYGIDIEVFCLTSRSGLSSLRVCSPW